ncbi:FUSC family protein [Thalassotalea piscium]|uniref:Integral membrane bound transporter domain-containing protein n=1 Tax=Thalassotalea piscium TaxID=1230533 RepID=A0A7X0NF89_9GAMM|nr:FUSC family protein [Thalassotalea piscium]MBB6542388.1 hypothetical protein [Thalassotalea piscium]
MYVTPSPKREDDPLYAIRLALTGIFVFIAVVLLDPALPPIIAALPIGLIAAQRKAFNLIKAVAGPIAMIVMVLIMSEIVGYLRPLPVVYVLSVWLIYFFGFYLILKSGAQAGMLIIVTAVLMSVMGMHGSTTLLVMRDGFIQASLVALIIGPLVYFLLPAKTKEKHVDEPQPHQGNIVVGALIRATVLIGLSFWLYAVMEPSDMMLAVIATMVIVFPTRNSMFFEAYQRIRATFYGSSLALAILMIFTISPHLPILLALVFLGGLWLGTKMLDSNRPSMVYQYGYSVALALIAGAISAQDPAYATFTRLVLTITGALSAAGLVAILDWIFNWAPTINNNTTASPLN